MNRTLTSLTLALSLLGPAAAFADPPAGGPPAGERGPRRGGPHLYELISRHAQELGISASTLESIKTALEAARPEAERLHQQMRQAHQSGDEAKIEAARTAMRAHKQATRAKIDALLTDKQRAALEELMKKQHPGRGKPPAAAAR